MELKAKVIKFLQSQDKSRLVADLTLRIRVRTFRRLRFSSEPFVSGDTFRSLAHVRLDHISDCAISKAVKKIESQMDKSNKNVIVFIDLHCVLELKDQQLFLGVISSFKLADRERISIVFHNHDRIPPSYFFCEIERLDVKCYCPNVIDNDCGVVPLPLGLENRYLQKNGVIRHFPKTRASVVSSVEGRPIGVFASFNIQTNLRERQEAADSAMKFGHEFNESRIHPSDFRKKLAKSLFVLSPPGNGIDCHRTWEAIYFGAIPVVKRGYLAESIFSDLPIYVVDDWSEICSMSRMQLERAYQLTIKKRDEKAYFLYWKKVLSNSTS